MKGAWRRFDKQAARRALEAADVPLIDGPFLDFRDPWGNRVEIVGYDNIQFTKATNVLRGMGLSHLAKNERAKQELAERACQWLKIDALMQDGRIGLRGERTLNRTKWLDGRAHERHHFC